MKKGDLFHTAGLFDGYFQKPIRTKKMVQFTGEKRPPKAGEWFLSGAIPEGYKAFNDMQETRHICKLVAVKVETVEKITIIP